MRKKSDSPWIYMKDVSPTEYKKKIMGKVVKTDYKYRLLHVEFEDGKQQFGWYDGVSWDFGRRKSKTEVIKWKLGDIDEEK